MLYSDIVEVRSRLIEAVDELRRVRESVIRCQEIVNIIITIAEVKTSGEEPTVLADGSKP